MALADTLPIREAQPRILVVRISALGDIVFATSLLDGLRARWPQAHIAWLAQERFAGILQDDPRIDELIRVSAEVFSRPSPLWKLRQRLAHSRYDWVIEAQGLFKTRVLARLAPGAVRIGFESKEPGAGWLHHRVEKGGDVREIGSEYRFLAQAITGFPAGPPALPIGPSLTPSPLPKGGGYTALCPFTTRPQKHWMEDCWPRLAALINDFGPFMLFGGPGDRAAADRIFRELPAGSIDLVGKTRLQELPGLLARARLVIGVDTGLTHMGVALKRPVVALFGSTCPYTGGADSPLTVMYDALPCAPCRRHPICGGAYTCMRVLTPERVAKAARALLARA